MSKDITNQRFGRLTAIRPTEDRICGSIIWECRCDCGNIKKINIDNLKKGNTKSCGCLKKEKTRKDISGMRFGRLTAIRPTEKKHKGYVVWECKCDCGNTAFKSTKHLTDGLTNSCGCLRKVRFKK